MKVVLDTNIYLSGAAFPESFPGKVLALARARKFVVYCSKFILGEIKKNLMVKFGYSESLSERFIEEILKCVKIIRPKIHLQIIKAKTDDNRILEAALASKADYLVSGDKKHILPLKKINSTVIISAIEFFTKVQIR